MKLFKLKKSIKQEPVTIRKRSFLSRIGRDPYVDWFIVVIISSIVSMGLIEMSLNKYLTFDETLRERVSISKPKEVSLMNTKSLEEVLQKFEDRATLRKELLRSYSGPGDPSI